MKTISIYILAILGGIFLAIQAGFNTHLSSYLKHPILAVITTSISSTLFGFALVLFLNVKLPPIAELPKTPTYLWFIGGLFSMIGISLYFYTIPKLGISKMIALGLCGQIIFSLIAGSLGWLNLPVEPLTSRRVFGGIAMIVGIFLINTK